ncbi:MULTISPECIES: hypothetical protein [Gluconobacter]|uniref:hypothetical protein n=1 Tax=Gluconobacter TaxID=441 RepID=UPI001CD8DE97|nr:MULTISPECIES: hypothetical protein [Gluconobacter]
MTLLPDRTAMSLPDLLCFLLFFCTGFADGALVPYFPLWARGEAGIPATAMAVIADSTSQSGRRRCFSLAYAATGSRPFCRFTRTIADCFRQPGSGCCSLMPAA